MSRPRISIVVPILDEEPVIDELLRRLIPVMGALDGDCEVVFVDDGSSDRSRELLVAASQHDPRIKVIGLSRTFGHQMAVTAGLDYARGEAVVTMDADLQDPPEVIPDMVARWREGFDVVYGVRADRSSDTRFKRGTARLFYRVLGRMSDVEIPADVGDFRLLDRRVVDEIGRMPERSRFLRGMVSWVGFKQTGVEYTRHKRHAGRTKYNFGRMVKFATDGIVNFSIAPLRLALKLGFVCVLLSLLAALVVVCAKIFGFFTVPGWTSLAVAVLLLGGVQVFLLGVVGEYVGRIYGEVKRRPLYVVSETFGVTPMRGSFPIDAHRLDDHPTRRHDQPTPTLDN